MTHPFPKIECERLHPLLPVRDVSKAVDFYTTRLGFTLGFTWPEGGAPTMAGVNLGDTQVFLGEGTPNPGGISVSFVVGNAYKRMSLSSCLEEILLHTNEPLGDGVASPHTKTQLRHIQELKKKHGIDYDSHGSYRFVEK
jgi:hypothetical protein